MATYRIAGTFTSRNLGLKPPSQTIQNVSQRCFASAPAAEPEKEKKSEKVGVQGTSWMIPYFGEPAGKKSMKMMVEKGKSYKWCACGHSRKQPFCDGNHNRVGLTQLRPVEYIAEATKQVSWCTCKLTALEKRPFCDSTHKRLPPGPLERHKEIHKLVAYDQYERIVDSDSSFAKKLGLRENKQGWILP